MVKTNCNVIIEQCVSNNNDADNKINYKCYRGFFFFFFEHGISKGYTSLVKQRCLEYQSVRWRMKICKSNNFSFRNDKVSIRSKNWLVTWIRSRYGYHVLL